jgi:hypothetical protein
VFCEQRAVALVKGQQATARLKGVKGHPLTAYQVLRIGWLWDP